MDITFKVRMKILYWLIVRRAGVFLRHVTHLHRPLCDCGYDTVDIISRITSLILKQERICRAESRLRLLELIVKECHGCICHKADIERCICYSRAVTALSAVRLLVFGSRNYEKLARLLAAAKLQGCFESLFHSRPYLTIAAPKPHWVRSVIPIDLNTGQPLWNWENR